MIFDLLKRILANLSKSATPDFTTEVEATGDIISGVSVLHTKIKHLNEFRQACDEVGLGDDFHKAAISAHAFAAKCLAFKNARGDSEDVTQAVLSQYEEVTSNLMALAISKTSRYQSPNRSKRGLRNTQ